VNDSAGRRVFVSYARDDDEVFVRWLRGGLVAQGFDVWWDRDAMESRGRTFLQVIRDAIYNVDWVIAVVGPAAVASQYVRYEWEYALLFSKGILPILRKGAFDQIPKRLSPEAGRGLASIPMGLLHCVDFRDSVSQNEALAEVSRLLRQPLHELGPTNGTPALPPHFLPRIDDLERLSELLLADVLRPTAITSAERIVALLGMGGVGKSVLAAAFGRSIGSRRAFENGVIWLTAGQEATSLTVLENIKRVGIALDDDPRHYVSEKTAAARLPALLADKICLIILDDVWSIDQVQQFRDALGERCRLLITTRDGELATSLGAQECRVNVLDAHQSVSLLTEWSNQEGKELPSSAARIAAECGNLPFALALCGAMIRDGTAWSDVLDALQTADLTFIDRVLPNYPHRNVLRAIQVSVQALGIIADGAIDRFHELAVFPVGQVIPEAVIVRLWSHSAGRTPRASRQLLTTLGRKALVRLEGVSPERIVSLHDLQHDYLRAVTVDVLSSLHAKSADAFAAARNMIDSSPNENVYVFRYIPYHLYGAKRVAELRELLLDPAWLRDTLETVSVQPLIQHYSYLADDPTMRSIRDGLQLSSHILAAYPKQLTEQLLARFLSFESVEIQALLRGLRDAMRGPWLQPIKATLEAPGGALQSTLSGDRVGDRALAITRSGDLVTLSADGVLQSWDLDSPFEPRIRTTSDRHISAIGLFPDGRKIIAAQDARLSVWDLHTGDEEYSLGAHEAEISCISVSNNGERAASGDVIGIAKSWDLIHRQEVCAWSAYSRGHRVVALAIMPDGERVLTAGWHGWLTIWRLSDGARLQYVGLPEEALEAFALTPDGRAVITSSWDDFGAINIWDTAHTGRRREMRADETRIDAVAVTPDGQLVASGSFDGTIRVWGLAGGNLVREITGTPAAIKRIAAAADGRVVTAELVDKVRVWNSRVSSPVSAKHQDSLSFIGLFADGGRVVSASGDGVLMTWDATTGERLNTWIAHQRRVTALVVSPVHQRAVTGGEDGSCRYWDLTNGMLLAEKRSCSSGIQGLALTSDGSHAVAGGVDGSLTLWDLDADEVENTVDAYVEAVVDLAITQDQGRMVTVSGYRHIATWVLRTGAEFRRSSFRGDLLGLLLPNGSLALVHLLDRTVAICDLEHDVVERSLGNGRDFGVGVRALVSSSRRRAVLTSNRGIGLWNLETGEQEGSLGRNNTWSQPLALTLDDRRLLVGTQDGACEVWELSSETCLCRFVGDAPISVGTFAAQGRIVVVGDSAGRVHFLRLEDANA
jgi:WD40 repeat protein